MIGTTVLPPKIQIYETLRSLGFPVKPAYYDRVGKNRARFLDEAIALLDVFPNVQIRTAPNKKIFSPNIGNLRTRKEIAKAYSEQEKWMLNYGNSDGYLLVWPFYPNIGLLTLNLKYTHENDIMAEMTFNHDQRSTTKGGTPDKLFLSYDGIETCDTLENGWLFLNPELKDVERRQLPLELYKRAIPEAIFEQGLQILRRYVPTHLSQNDKFPVESLLEPKRNLELVIETATQFGSSFPRYGLHFVTDYYVKPKPILGQD